MTSPLPSILSPREVSTVTGHRLTVQTEAEARWYDQTRDNYLKELKLTEQTDLSDLDRVLTMELMNFRIAQQAARGIDYEGKKIDIKQLQVDMRGNSDQLSKLKDSMGITKKQREAIANDGNFAAWLEEKKRQAKAFGIHRENQLAKVLAMGNDIFAVVDIFTRADDEERRKFGYPTERAVLDWIHDELWVEFQKLDEYFVEHEQKLWRRD